MNEELIEEYKIWDYVGIQEIADEVGISYIRVLRFFQADQRSEEIEYSEEAAIATVRQMIKELKSDLEGKQYKIETLQGKIARETGLELVGEDTHITREGVW